MKPTNQQCITCDSPINGEAYHLILGGSIYRFCCHTHRQEYAHAATQWMESGPRSRITSFIAQRAS
jgi:hypothetical protein